jgi:hypothetical protein
LGQATSVPISGGEHTALPHLLKKLHWNNLGRYVAVGVTWS